ncbi:FxLYD domain-containing protein, partial [Clostridia bacterium OttesenSCG-928-O13]|nr:FxLYD domain-containing protein [Clostridia bacterium OttesenSCG-928-O13]
VVLFMLFGMPSSTAPNGGAVTEQYEALLEEICQAESPRNVVRFRGRLDTFNEENPGVVDDDLETLVAVCEDYQSSAQDREDTFTEMIDALDKLGKSDIKKISTCAKGLQTAVNSDYEEYLDSLESSSSSETSGSSSSSKPTNDDPFGGEIPFEMLEDLAILDGENGFSLRFQNTSGKTIEAIEVWVYCYDAQGNPIEGMMDNIEWDWDYPFLADGEIYGPEDYGFFSFYYCEDVVFALPFISYVEFSDGSYWGINDEVADFEDVFMYMEIIKELADEAAKDYV